MGYANIIVEREGAAGLITLNRPAVLNALNTPLMDELEQAIAELLADDVVRAIVFTGAGERAFSAGGDIHEMAAVTVEEEDRRRRHASEFFWKLATLEKPTIGAINGIAYGGAALMASCFDIRIGCERTRFRFLAAAYGRLNTTWTLPLVVAAPKAKELLFTARAVDAQEAKEMGLLNQVVPSGELLAAALQMAQAIAVGEPQTVGAFKASLNESVGSGWPNPS